MTPTSSLPAWLARGVEALGAGDVDGWMQIYAPDAIHEFPFAPPGAVRILEGPEAISAYLAQLPSLLRFGTLSDVRVREVEDELIVEATGHHRRVADDTPMELGYVWFITVVDGHVKHMRDYMNPLQL
jgi:ketosteroid isomerase-like protein